MSYDLLIEVIEKFRQYEESFSSYGSLSLKGFASFLSHSEQSVSEDIPKLHSERHLNSIIARDISFLYRHTRGYVRRALKDSELDTVDEYSYLISLMSRGNMTKTELNNINVIEKTTGTEIIRRLLNKGLVEQTPNSKDKRSWDVAITEKGVTELRKVLPQLQVAADVLLAPLSFHEKVLLHQMHSHLCRINQDLFLNHKEDSLAELVRTLK